MMVKVVTDEEKYILLFNAVWWLTLFFSLNINDQNIANFTNQVQDIVKNEVERIDAENAGKDDFDDDVLLFYQEFCC